MGPLLKVSHLLKVANFSSMGCPLLMINWDLHLLTSMSSGINLFMNGEEVADLALALIIHTNTYLIADLVRGGARVKQLNDFRTKYMNQDGALGAKHVGQIGTHGVQGTEEGCVVDVCNLFCHTK